MIGRRSAESGGEAFPVIAEMRDYDRLRKLLETSSDHASFLSPPCSKGKADMGSSWRDWSLLRAKIGQESSTSSAIHVI